MIRALALTISVIIAVGVFFAGTSSAHPMWGIAVDRQGQVYFSDLKTVWKIDAQGKLSVFRPGVDSHTHDLNIDEAGNVYGAENSYEPQTQRFLSGIWKMTPDGSFSYLLNPTDSPPKGTSIWKDGDGNMYHVAYYRERELLILKRTPGGVVTALVGSQSALRNYRQSVPYSAGGMAFGADGTLYFVHGTNVSKLTTNGTLTPLIREMTVENATENPGGSSLFGIAVDARSNVLVADYGNRRVLKITPEGQMTTLVQAEESWFPTGVAARDGEVYILEYGHTPTHAPLGTRVRKLSPDGKIAVLAMIGENANPPASLTPAEASGETAIAAPEKLASYWLIGLCASLFALSFVVWCRRRKKVNKSGSQ